MTKREISFRTSDNVLLRGWLFTPSVSSGSQEKLPCLILGGGFACVAPMLFDIAETLTATLPLICILYDQRGFGGSETLPGLPRQEVLPSVQAADLRDAITFAQLHKDIDPKKIGLWGYSYSGGLCLYVAAVDRRVKTVISLGPMTDGWENFLRLTPAHVALQLCQAFEADRLARAQGGESMMVPIISEDPTKPCGLPSRESYEYFSQWETNGSGWKNELTIRSVEEICGNTLAQSHLSHITPTPVLMTVALKDTNTPPDLSMRAYQQLSEPKELCIVEGNHYDILGKCRSGVHDREVAFLKRTLCK